MKKKVVYEKSNNSLDYLKGIKEINPNRPRVGRPLFPVYDKITKKKIVWK